MVEPQLTKFAQVTPLGTSFRNENEKNKSKRKLSYFHNQNSSGEFQTQCAKSAVRYSQNKGDISERGFFKSEKKSRSKSSDSKEESVELRSSNIPVLGSVMQTLDRRISASSDQLDTLKKVKSREKPLRTSSSSRISFERKFVVEERTNQDQTPAFTRKRGSRRSHDKPKTPFEIFLENDGPYSRQMYGPATPNPKRVMHKNHVVKPLEEYESNLPSNFHTRKEKLAYTNAVKQNNNKVKILYH